MIKSSNISVVVQGAIDPILTKQCLISVRKSLPNAEIILSTWKNSDVTGLVFDKVIFNSDPGAYFQNLNGYHHFVNINRMLLSTKNGIAVASNDYILKIRSDMFVKKASFLKFFDKWQYKDMKYVVFNHKIIAYPFFSFRLECLMNKVLPTCFFVSDMCYFGQKNDIIELFSCNLVKEPEYTHYFLMHEKDKEKDIFLDRTWKMSPEQYIIYSLVFRHFPNINFENYLDYNDKNINFSHKFIMNNFIFLDCHQWGIDINKDKFKNWENTCNLVTFNNMYRNYNFKKYYYQLFFNKSYKAVDILFFKSLFFRFIIKIVNILRKFLSCFIPSKKLRHKIRGKK